MLSLTLPAASRYVSTVRAIVSETRQDAALDALRREGLRLISLTPVRMSLEDYFVQQLKPSGVAVAVTS